MKREEKLARLLYLAIYELEAIQSVENCHSGLCASSNGRAIVKAGMELLEVADLSTETLPRKAPKPAKRIPTKREKPRVRKTVVRLKGAEMAQLRASVYVRDEARCVDCLKRVYLTQPPLMELSHIKSRGAGGSDTMENTVCRCRECHAKSHNAGGKPVPAKGTHIR